MVDCYSKQRVNRKVYAEGFDLSRFNLRLGRVEGFHCDLGV